MSKRDPVEGLLLVLEAAATLGLLSGTAVALAMGKFMLGGVLTVLALGVFLRFKRRRARSAGQGKH